MLLEQSTSAVPRVVVFLAALVLAVGAGWTAGRVGSPPIPVPELPAPAVFGGPGSVGGDPADADPAGTAPLLPRHGGHPLTGEQPPPGPG